MFSCGAARKLVVLELFFDTTHMSGACPSIIKATLTDQTQSSLQGNASSESQRYLLEAEFWCRYALRAVHIACVGVLVCACAVLGMTAVVVREYVSQASSGPDHSVLVDDEHCIREARDEKR